ncbi:olfactory receptor 6N1, partial [Xenopus laevis]|uniref:Olfactory receptor n=2 Tax=Xenopus laevis TaxID=8355 RepID=A0A8J0T9D6_XENLA
HYSCCVFHIKQFKTFANQTGFTYIWIAGFQDLHESRKFLFMVVLLIYLVIITGNLLVVSVVFSDSRLHSPMYFFLAHLSSSEIIFTTNILPNFLNVLWEDGGKMSVYGCFTQFYLCGSLAATECFLLTVMSYDRYVAICKPLHYASIMKFSVCRQIAAWCWIGGFISLLTTLILVCQLHFCGLHFIDHFFCDFAPILDLSCSDTSVVKLETSIFSSSVTLFPFMFITGTYIAIIITVVNMRSSTGRRKSFSTCSSHLAIVSLYYGTLITVYVIPTRGKSKIVNKIVSLMYSIVTPLLNPIIYSLRNKKIKTAIRNVISN